LLGDTSRPADALTAEAALTGFDTDVSGQATTQLEVDQLRTAAEQVAARAVQSLGPLLGCDPAVLGEDACAGTFIDRFAGRAYRRALTATEKARLRALFDFGRKGATFASGVRLVIEAVLQAPQFLYRPELGEAPATGATWVALTGHELATRLAFFLTGTLPDQELRAAADANQLRTPEAVAAQARRLLAKPDAAAVLSAFHHQWLELERLESSTKDPKLFPGFDKRMVAALEGTTRAFVQHVYLDRPDAPLGELFTANYVFTDGSTARTFGLPASTAIGLKKTTVTEPRSGLLSDATLMSALASAIETQPVGRGAFVRQRLLCQVVPAPPDNMAIEVPPPKPNLTTRERYAAHRTNAVCAGCHSVLDPIGMGFESWDAVGRYRATENGKAIDVSGELTGTSKSDGVFRGTVELGKRLATSTEAARCLAHTWMTFALGRAMGAADEPAVNNLGLWLGGPDGKLRELLVGIATSNAFRFRPPLVVEACK
jgi:hypothetical protein